jgi:hypothetical protein
MLAVGSGARLLEFRTDYRSFFSEQNPELKAFEQMQQTFNKSDSVLFVLAPASGNVFEKDTLKAIEELTDGGWQMHLSTRVDSLRNYQHTQAEGDDLMVGDLYENPDNLTADDIQRIRDIALHEPLILQRLVSPKGDVAAVNVTFELPDNPVNDVPVIVKQARELAAKVKAAHPGLEIHLTGIIMMNAAFAEASFHDMKTLVPLMFLVTILTLGFLIRSTSGTFTTVLVIAFAIAGGMGLAGWLGWFLTGPSASAPTIILTMSVADAVHLLIGYVHYLRGGMSRKDAMAESVRVNFQPVFLTSVTTIVGFLSMNFSEVPPFHDLGNMVSFGVGFAWILTMTFLPALMVVLPIRVGKAHPDESPAMERLANWVIRRRGTLLVSVSLVSLALLTGIPKNELDDQFVQYFDKSVPFRQATDFANERLSGIYNIEYALDSQTPGGISNPGFLKKVEAFANWARSQPEVRHVNAITDIFKRLNQNMHGDDPAYYRIPEERNLAAQYLLLYEMSLPYGLDLNNQINIDKSATRVTVTFENLSSTRMLELEKRFSGWLHDHAPEIKAFAASPTLMFAHIGQRNIRSMLTGTTIALIAISLILVVSLRSLTMGIVSLIPNLIPVAIAFGLWGYWDGQVGMALAMVASMTLGIVVDDTIHFLSKYLRARREKGLDPLAATRYAFSHVGLALTVTTLVLVAGFGVLAFSTFSANADMGVLTAATIAIALAIDFFLLPPLLLKMEEKHHA